MRGHTTILLAEDDDISRHMLGMHLRAHGYHVIEACNGVEAMARAAEHVPDIVLLDLMMPQLDGLEVCRKLRAHHRLREVPILMITALSGRDVRLQAIEAGADDFISKPIDLIELRMRLRTIVRLNRYRQLLAARMQVEWVLDQAEDGYLILAADDTIVYANQQARRTLGLAIHGPVPAQTQFLSLAQQHYQCEPREVWATWPTSGKSAVPRYLLQPEHEKQRACWLHVDMLAIPLNDQDGWLVQLRNVTEQVALQRAMHSFHAMVAHRFRTPLLSLFAGIQLIETLAPTLPQARVVEMLRASRAGAQQMRDEINTILAYIGAETLARQSDGVAIGQIAALAETVGAQVGVRQLVVRCPPELAAMQCALSDYALELVLWAIFDNSKKFHPAQAPVVEIWLAHERPDRVRLTIRNDGHTVPPHQQAHVWAPYYKDAGGYAASDAGLGLGLAIVSSIVWSVGGTCSLHNRDDARGVCIELSVPLARPS